MATEIVLNAPSCDQGLKINNQKTFESEPLSPAYQKDLKNVAELTNGLADPSKDSDSEEDEASPRPQHITERRRAQNAIFSSWYEHKSISEQVIAHISQDF